VSGDRELFFPYTMYLASHVALGFSQRNVWLASLGGGGLVAAFMAIRVLQNATERVLAVELIVAVAILAFALVAHAWSRKQAVSDAAIVAGASLLAYASLSI
jgi:multisubunit Na+/H+ antiporter MnhF subunit